MGLFTSDFKTNHSQLTLCENFAERERERELLFVCTAGALNLATYTPRSEEGLGFHHRRRRGAALVVVVAAQ